MNRISTSRLFVVVAALLMIVSAGFGFTRWPSLQDDQPTPQAEPDGKLDDENEGAGAETPSPVESATLEVDTPDWKTYRNEVYGFEIEYPEDWLLYEVPQEDVEAYLGMSEKHEMFRQISLVRWERANDSIAIIGYIDSITNELIAEKITLSEAKTVEVKERIINGWRFVEVSLSDGPGPRVDTGGAAQTSRKMYFVEYPSFPFRTLVLQGSSFDRFRERTEIVLEGMVNSLKITERTR